MTDTEIVDEILHKLKSANAGHFDRVNMLDILGKVIYERNDLVVDSVALDFMRTKGLDEEIQRTVDSLTVNVGRYV